MTITLSNVATSARSRGHEGFERPGPRGRSRIDRGVWLRDVLCRSGVIAQAALRRVAFWRERARQRRALADLDDRLLRDIGLTRAEAERECAKRPWN